MYLPKLAAASVTPCKAGAYTFSTNQQYSLSRCMLPPARDWIAEMASTKAQRVDSLATDNSPLVNLAGLFLERVGAHKFGSPHL
jgi:hypothetical protein